MHMKLGSAVEQKNNACWFHALMIYLSRFLCFRRIIRLLPDGWSELLVDSVWENCYMNQTCYYQENVRHNTNLNSNAICQLQKKRYHLVLDIVKFCLRHVQSLGKGVTELMV